MKEKQAVNKLKMLKTIQPTRAVLNGIKLGIYQQIKAENTNKAYGFQELLDNIFIFVKSYGTVSYSLAFVLLLIILLSVSSVLFSTKFQNIVLYSKLAFASNQYQKAQIAFVDTTGRFKEGKPIDHKALELSQSLALTNAQLNSLELKGEKGRYSAQQCHEIYQKYLNYLENEEKDLSTKNSSFAKVKFQINSYEEQAEKKLHMYNSL